MKLHLPSGLRKALLACLAAVALPAASLPSTIASASGIAAFFLLASHRASAAITDPHDWGASVPATEGSSSPNTATTDTDYTVEGNKSYVFTTGEDDVDIRLSANSEARNTITISLTGEFAEVWITCENARVRVGAEQQFNANIDKLYVGGGAQLWFYGAQFSLNTELHLGSTTNRPGWSSLPELNNAALALEGTTLTTTGTLVLEEDAKIAFTGTGASQLTVGGLTGGGDAVRTLTLAGNNATMTLSKEGGASVSGQMKIDGSLTMRGKVTLAENSWLEVTGTLASSSLARLTLSSGSRLTASVDGNETLTVADLTIDGEVSLKLSDGARLSIATLSGEGSLTLDLTDICRTGKLDGYQLFEGDISSWYDDWKDQIIYEGPFSNYILNSDGTLTIEALRWTGADTAVTLGDDVSGDGWEEAGAVTGDVDVILQGTEPGEITVTVSGGEDNTIEMNSLTIGTVGGSSTYTLTADTLQTLTIGGALVVNAATTFNENVKLKTEAGSKIILGADLTLNGGWDVSNLSGEHQVSFESTDPSGPTREVVLEGNSNLSLLNAASTSKVFFGEGIGLVWDAPYTGEWIAYRTRLTMSLDEKDFQGRYVELKRGMLTLECLDDEYPGRSWTTVEGVKIIGDEGSNNLTIVGVWSSFTAGVHYEGGSIRGDIDMRGASLQLTFSMELNGRLDTADNTTVTFSASGVSRDNWFAYGSGSYPYTWRLMKGGSIGKLVMDGPYEIFPDADLTIHGGITDDGMTDDERRYAISFQRYNDPTDEGDEVQVVDIVDGTDNTVNSKSGLVVEAGIKFVKQGTGTQTFGGGGGSQAKPTDIAGKLVVEEGTLKLNGGGRIRGEISGDGTLAGDGTSPLSITGGGSIGTLALEGGELTIGEKGLQVGTWEGTNALTKLTLGNNSHLTINGGVLKADAIAFTSDSDEAAAGATLHLKVGKDGGARLSFKNVWSSGKLTIQLEGWSDLVDKTYQLFENDERFNSFWTQIQEDVSQYFIFTDESGKEVEHLVLGSDGRLSFAVLQEWNEEANELEWGTDNEVWKQGTGSNQKYNPSLSVLFDGRTTPVTVTLVADIKTEHDMTVQRGAGVGEEEQVYTFEMGNHSLTVDEKLTVREGISAEFTGSGALTVSGGTDVSGTLIVGTSGQKNLGAVQVEEGGAFVVKDGENWGEIAVNGTGALVYDGVKGTTLDAWTGDSFTGQIELRGGASLTQEGDDLTKLGRAAGLVVGADAEGGDISSFTFTVGGNLATEIELGPEGELVVSGSSKLTLSKLNAAGGKLTLSGALDVTFSENTSFSALKVNAGGELTTGMTSGAINFGDITLTGDGELHLTGILSDLTLGAKSITGGRKITISLNEDFLQLIADGTGQYRLFEGTSWAEQFVAFTSGGYTVNLGENGNITVVSKTPGARDEFTGYVYHATSDTSQTLTQNAEITVNSTNDSQLTFDDEKKPLLNLKLVAGSTEVRLNNGTSFTGLNSVYFTGESDFIDNGSLAGGGPKTIYIKGGQLYFSSFASLSDVLDLRSDFVIGSSQYGRKDMDGALALSKSVTTTGSLTLEEDAVISFWIQFSNVMTFGGAVHGKDKTLSLHCQTSSASNFGTLVLQGGGILRKLESDRQAVDVVLQMKTLTLQEGGTIEGTLKGDGAAGLEVSGGTLSVRTFEGSLSTLTLGQGARVDVGSGTLTATTFNMEGDATIGIGKDVTLNFTNSQTAGSLTLDLAGLLEGFDGVQETYDLFDKDTFADWYQQFTENGGAVVFTNVGEYEVSLDETTGQITWTYNNGLFEYQGKDGEQLVWDTTTAGASTHWEGDKQWKDGSMVLFSATDADNEVLIGSDLQVLSMQVSSGGGYHFSSSTAEGWTLNVGELVVDENVTMEFDENVHLSFGSLTVFGASSTERNTMILKGGAEVDNFSNNTNVDYVLGGDLVIHGWTGTAADSVRFSKEDGVTGPVFVEFNEASGALATIRGGGLQFDGVGLKFTGTPGGDSGTNPSTNVTIYGQPDNEWKLTEVIVDKGAVLALRTVKVTIDHLTVNGTYAHYHFATYGTHDLLIGDEDGRRSDVTVTGEISGDGGFRINGAKVTLREGGTIGSLWLDCQSANTDLFLGGDLKLYNVGRYSGDDQVRFLEYGKTGDHTITLSQMDSLPEGTDSVYVLFRCSGITSSETLEAFAERLKPTDESHDGVTVDEGIGIGVYGEIPGRVYTINNGGTLSRALKIENVTFNLNKPTDGATAYYQFRKKVVVTEGGTLSVNGGVEATFEEGVTVQGEAGVKVEEGTTATFNKNVQLEEGSHLTVSGKAASFGLTVANGASLTVSEGGKLSVKEMEGSSLTTLAMGNTAELDVQADVTLSAETLEIGEGATLLIENTAHLDIKNMTITEGVERGCLTLNIEALMEMLNSGGSYDLWTSGGDLSPMFREFENRGGSILLAGGDAVKYELNEKGQIVLRDDIFTYDGSSETLTWGTDQEDSGWEKGRDWTTETQGGVVYFTAASGTHKVDLTSDIVAEHLRVQGDGSATYNVGGAHTLTLDSFQANSQVTMSFGEGTTLQVGGDFTSEDSASSYTFAEKLTVGGTLSLSGTDGGNAQMTLTKGGAVEGDFVASNVTMTGAGLDVGGDFTSENSASSYTFAEKLTVGGTLSLSGTDGKTAEMTLKGGGTVAAIDARNAKITGAGLVVSGNFVSVDSSCTFTEKLIVDRILDFSQTDGGTAEMILDKGGTIRTYRPSNAPITLGGDLELIGQFYGGFLASFKPGSFKKKAGTDGDVYVKLNTGATFNDTTKTGENTSPFDGVGLRAGAGTIVNVFYAPFFVGVERSEATWNFNGGNFWVEEGAQIVISGGTVTAGGATVEGSAALWLSWGTKLTLNKAIVGDGALSMGWGEAHLKNGGRLGEVNLVYDGTWGENNGHDPALIYLGADLEIESQINTSRAVGYSGYDNSQYMIKREEDTQDTVYVLFNTGGGEETMRGTIANFLNKELDRADTMTNGVALDEGVGIGKFGTGICVITDAGNDAGNTLDYSFKVKEGKLSFSACTDATRGYTLNGELVVLSGASVELQSKARATLSDTLTMDDGADVTLGKDASLTVSKYHATGTTGGTIKLSLTGNQKVEGEKTGTAPLFFSGMESKLILSLNGFDLEGGGIYQVFDRTLGADFLSALVGKVDVKVTNGAGFIAQLNDQGQIVVTKEDVGVLTWNNAAPGLDWELNGEQVWDVNGQNDATVYEANKNVVFAGRYTGAMTVSVVNDALNPIDVTIERVVEGSSYIFNGAAADTTLEVQGDLFLGSDVDVSFNLPVTVGRSLHTAGGCKLTLSKDLVVTGYLYLQGGTGEERVIFQNDGATEEPVYVTFYDIIVTDENSLTTRTVLGKAVNNVITCNSSTAESQIEFNGIGIHKTGDADLNLYCYNGGGIKLDKGHLTLISPLTQGIGTIVHGDVSVGGGSRLTFLEPAQITGRIESDSSSTVELCASVSDNATTRYLFEQGGSLKTPLEWGGGPSSLFVGDDFEVGGLSAPSFNSQFYNDQTTLPVSTDKEGGVQFTINLTDGSSTMLNAPEFRSGVDLKITSNAEVAAWNNYPSQTFLHGMLARGNVTIDGGTLIIGYVGNPNFEPEPFNSSIEGKLEIKKGWFSARYSKFSFKQIVDGKPADFSDESELIIGSKGANIDAVFQYTQSALEIHKLTMRDRGLFMPAIYKFAAPSYETIIDELIVDTSEGQRAGISYYYSGPTGIIGQITPFYEPGAYGHNVGIVTLTFKKLSGNGEFDLYGIAEFEKADQPGVIERAAYVNIELIDGFNGRLMLTNQQNVPLQVGQVNTVADKTVDLALDTEISGELSGDGGTLKFSKSGGNYLLAGGGDTQGRLELGAGTNTTVEKSPLSVGALAGTGNLTVNSALTIGESELTIDNEGEESPGLSSLTLGEGAKVTMNSGTLRAQTFTAKKGVEIDLNLRDSTTNGEGWLDFVNLNVYFPKLKIGLGDTLVDKVQLFAENPAYANLWNNFLRDRWINLFDFTVDCDAWGVNDESEMVFILDEHGVLTIENGIDWSGAQSGIWTDDGITEWQGTEDLLGGDLTGKNVHFKKDGKQDVQIGGTVHPSNVFVEGGYYTFRQREGDEDGGGMALGPNGGGILTVGGGEETARLTLALKNTSISEVRLRENGTLVLADDGALTDDTMIEFRGGTLEYSGFESFTLSDSAADVSRRVVKYNRGQGSTEAVKVSVDAAYTEGVTWGGAEEDVTKNGGLWHAVHESESEGGGMEKSGTGKLTLEWKETGTEEQRHRGNITVEGGELQYRIRADKDTEATVTLLGDVAVSKGGSLTLDVGCSTTLSGEITGGGTVRIASGEVTLGGERDVVNTVAFIEVDSGATLIAGQKSALGGEGTTLKLNGGTLRAAEGVEVNSGTVDVVAEKSYVEGTVTLNGELISEESKKLTAKSGSNGTITHALTSFKGTLDTEAADSIWTLTGNALGGEKVSVAVSGSGVVEFAGKATYSGKVSDSVTLRSDSAGKQLTVTTQESSTGAKLDGNVTLGNLGTQAQWNGTELVSGNIYLSNVELGKNGIVNKGGAKLYVNTARIKTTKEGKAREATPQDSLQGGIVNVNGMGGTKLDGITINQHGQLTGITGRYTANSAHKLELHFTGENVGSSKELGAGEKALITSERAGGFTLDANSKDDDDVKLHLGTGALASVIGILAGASSDDTADAYLRLVKDGELRMGNIELNDLKGEEGDGNEINLLKSLHIESLSAEGGWIKVTGSAADVFVVLDGPPCVLSDEDDKGKEALKALSKAKATVLAHKDGEHKDDELSLTLKLDGATHPAGESDVTLRNLLGEDGSQLCLNNRNEDPTAEGNRLEVAFDNTHVPAFVDADKYPKDIDGTTVYGQDTTFNGNITGGAGVDVKKQGLGTLTVGGNYTLEDGTTTLAEGALRLRGKENSMENLAFSYTGERNINGKQGAEGELNPEERGLLLEGGAEGSKTTITGSITEEEGSSADGNEIDMSGEAELVLKGKSELSSTRITGDEENDGGKLTLDGAGAGLTLNGTGASIDDEGKVTGAQLSGVNVRLTNEGSLTLGPNAGMDVGTVELGKGGTLDIGSGKANHVEFLGPITEKDGSTDGNGTLKSAKGGELHVGGGSFSGTLDRSGSGPDDGAGTLVVDSGAEFTLDNVTTTNDSTKAWGVELNEGSNLTVDVSKKDAGNGITLGDIDLGNGTMRVDYGNNVNPGAVSGTITGVGTNGTLDFYSSVDWGNVDSLSTGITVADGLREGFEKHITFSGAGNFFKDSEAHVDPETGNITVNSQEAEGNKFERLLPDMSKNARAGASMVWDSLKEKSGDEMFYKYLMDPMSDYYGMASALIGLYDNGDKEGLEKALAAVAGTSVSVLGPAFVEDLHRQLTTMRNRTTMTSNEQHLEKYDAYPTWHAWLNAEGAYRKLDADGFAPGYTLNSWGGTVGVDADVSERTTVGLALTAMYGDLKTESTDVGKGDLDTMYLSAFARTTRGAWSHTVVMSAGMADVSLDRTVNVGGMSYRTQGSTDGYAVGVLYEVGYTKLVNRKGTVAFQPVFNVELRHAALKGYTETGSNAGLKVDDIEQDVVTFGVGARMQGIVGENLYNRTSILEGRLLVKGDVGDRSGVSKNALIGSARTGEVESAEVGALGIEAGVGLSIPLGSKAGNLFFDASTELRSGQTSFDATVGYRISF